MNPETDLAVADVLHSGYIGQGVFVERFEDELKKFFGEPCHLLTVNSCTSALELALHLIDSPGAEVLTSAVNCLAGVSCILARGMRPRFLDVEDFGNVCLLDVESKLSPSTAAVLFPHLCGLPVNLRKLYAILRAHYEHTGKPVWIIEDCAHALGSHYYGELIGTQHLEGVAPYPWTLKCFSFQSVKVLTTGDGGALIVPNEQLLQRAKRLRWFGLDRGQDRYTQDVPEAGFKYQLNNIAAAIGIANLQDLPVLLEAQQLNWDFYRSELLQFRKLMSWLPMVTSDSACSLYPVWVEDKGTFQGFLRSKGIEVNLPHVRADKYSCMQPYRERLRGVDDYEKHVTCIPAGWWVGEREREQVLAAIKEWADVQP